MNRFDPAQASNALHAIQRRLLAEDFVRLRRADEQRRYLASQRRGRIDPNPHQIDAVVFALQRIPEGGCILADEVGLGKTIEAGLVMAQLLAEGMSRILLIVPKSLLGQWQMELRNLFGIETREGQLDPEAFAGGGVFLVHREFAGGRGASLLKEGDAFDLVVIDEAHEFFANIYKRFDQEGNYRPDAAEAQIADRVRDLLKKASTPVLLLTATPIQNSLAELWGLVQYVEPTNTLLGKYPTFRDVFCADNGKSLVKGQEFELRRRLGSVLQRTLRSQAKDFLEVPFVERQAKLIEYEMGPEEAKLYDDVSAWLLDPHQVAFSGKNRQLLRIGFLRRMGSSLAALSASLENVAARLRKRLTTGDVDAEVGLATEFAKDLEEDADEFSESDEDVPVESVTGERIRRELRRMEGFIERARSITRESKADCLLKAVAMIRERERLGQGTGKVVIFTESLKTQDYLRDLLIGNEYRPDDVTLFRGQNDGPRAEAALAKWLEAEGRTHASSPPLSREVATRLALVHEFKHHSKVLIATEAGAKGLNLQFCENLVNYDLPWNPQRIEQRIGRVHRYGQRSGVTILNLLDRGNEAQQLTFDILCKKLELFGKVLGAADAILHVPSTDTPERLVWGIGNDFEHHLRRIYGQARSLQEVTRELRRLRETIDEKRREFEEEQARVADLIKSRIDDRVRAVFTEKYSKPQVQAGLAQLDHDMDVLVRAYFDAVGTAYERVPVGGGIVYRVSPSPHYSEGAVFVIGMSDATRGEPLYHGHPIFQAALDEARSATMGSLAVELGPRERGLAEALVPFADCCGRLAVTRVSYRGLESVDHFLVTAILEGNDQPIYLTLEDVVGTVVRDATPTPSPPAISDRDLDEAIAEAVLRDLAGTSEHDQQRFDKRLAQLDRYLEDQELACKKKRSGLQRKLDKLNKGTVAPSEVTRRDREIHSIEHDLRELNERIEQLQRSDDDDYQRWREQLYERRFRRPHVERILLANFRILGESSC
jgi:adenine-specific DNA-methyltransferase